MKTLLPIILTALLCANPAASEDKPMQIKDALNTPSSTEKPGSRPYEMEARKDVRVPLVDFQDLDGWTVQCCNSADAELARSREQRIWGEFVGKLTYTGKTEDGTVILRPPKPIPIKDAFDCVNMWLYGNVWEWAPEPGTPFVNVSVIVLDTSGKEQALAPTRMRWKEWWLTHVKLPKPMRSAHFAGIKVEGINNAEPKSIYFGALYFYNQQLKPITFAPRPARNLKLLPGQDQGLNGTGPGRLPFPTREETILPSNNAKDYAIRLDSPVKGCYEFLYKARDRQVKYVYRPATGGLGEIEAWVNERKVCVPLSGGGIEIDGAVVAGTLVDSEIKDGELRLAFDLASKNGKAVRADYVFRIRQKSLVMDFACRGGSATGLAFGNVEGVAKARLVHVPYITFGWQANPRVLCCGEPDDPVFVSVWADWYRSNGSAPWTEQWANENSAKINGGVRYIAKTDGKRNDLYERVFLTVSPVFEEALPTIANPPSPRGKIAGERLWQESWGPGDYAKEMERCRMLRSYGIDKLTQCNHEITWRDGGESFTLRTKAAPGKGGDKALKDYIAHQKSLGWLSGLYTNYCDFAPVNENWSEDYVQLTENGDWRPAWPRNYALKPSRAVELDAKYGPLVKSKFGSNAAYTDVQTAVAPWGYVDYDARVPGAGTFAATFYAYGELLLNDQKVYGPVWSEGTYQWLYAGLASGNYGLCYDGVDMSKEPLNVAFDLLKIHPLECDIGMPWTSHFFKDPGWDKPENIDESVDHLIAATIAYGHIGWLVEESYGIERTCRSYYMLQQLQKRYAMEPVAKIEYADADGKMLTVSQAIARDALKNSRLHVVYRNGLEVYVNGSTEVWPVSVSGFPLLVQLPSWGWVAWDKKGEFVEFSAMMDGHRVDYVKSPEYEYLDGRGHVTVWGGIRAKGGVAVRHREGSIEVIDIYGNEEIGVRTDFAKCLAYDADGKNLGEAKLRREGGMTLIQTIKGARSYVLRAP